LIHKGKKALILAKCHDQELQEFSMEGKTYWNVGTKFHNFRSYTKFYMNFYRFKLALDRLKLIDKPRTRSIFIIFLEPRID
jgi:hypothetical protein